MATETVRSRFQKTMSGVMPDDRLPQMEFAPWWDLTFKRFKSEGLPEHLSNYEALDHFGLDPLYQFWFHQFAPNHPPHPNPVHGQGWISSEADYDALRPYLYPEVLPMPVDILRGWAKRQARGEIVMWMTVDGFFWWPRVLFGIEAHLYAFYDHPDLMHRINQDLVEYIKRAAHGFFEIAIPDMITFAEDMSYNHGPMISKELFEEFLAPYYNQVVPLLKSRGSVTMIDSDGGVEPLIPWFREIGLQGIVPLERMAGVDINRIRKNHPEWCMLGGFDKTVMHLGEDAMRQEFERILPVMKSLRYVPSVDHQTPPGVSLKDYELYVRLLKEYVRRAVEE